MPEPSEQPWISGAATVTISRDGTLRVSGSGPMEDYDLKGELRHKFYPDWFLAERGRDRTTFFKAVIEEGVTRIGDFAFPSSHNLQSVAIPASVASIGESAFLGCCKLASVKIAADNARYCSVDDVIFNKDKTVLIMCPSGKHGAYTIPNSVTTIGKYAFAGYDAGYPIGGSDNYIEARYEHRLTCCSYVTILGRATIINEYEFDGAYLESITIPNSVTTIEEFAFAGACFESIIIPNSVTAIGEGAFKNCDRLTSVTIPKSVKSIPKNTFKLCRNLTSVKIEDGVTAIGDYAFAGCKRLKHVIIPSSVKTIGDYAFAQCDSLRYLTIEKGVKHIGTYAFVGCRSLRSVTIPSGITKIEEGTFSNCWELRSVTIPSSVTDIEADAFGYANNIAAIAVRGLIPPSVGPGAFNDSWKDARLYVPAISIIAYRFADTWKKFSSAEPVEFYEMSVAKIVLLCVLTAAVLFAAVFVIIKKLRKSSVRGG